MEKSRENPKSRPSRYYFFEGKSRANLLFVSKFDAA